MGKCVKFLTALLLAVASTVSLDVITPKPISAQSHTSVTILHEGEEEELPIPETTDKPEVSPIPTPEVPLVTPTPEPSITPDPTVTPAPTVLPSEQPTASPEVTPEIEPTLDPTIVPTASPEVTLVPTLKPELSSAELLNDIIPVHSQDMQRILDNFIAILIGNDDIQKSGNSIINSKITTIQKNANNRLKAFIPVENRSDSLFTKVPLGSSEANLTTSFNYLLQMAQGYHSYIDNNNGCGASYKSGTPNCYQDPQIPDVIVEGLNWIYENYYKETEQGYYGNWYAWEIGHPISITKILALMETEITQRDPELIPKYIAVMDAYLRNGNGDIDLDSRFHTGSNLADIAVNRMVQAALINDEARLQKAVNDILTVFSTIDPNNIQHGNTDGYYADGSFIQHHRVAYTGTYGVNLLDKVMTTLKLLNGTPWSPEGTLLNTVQEWIYHGFTPVVFEGYMMEIVKGRSIAKNSTGYSNNPRFIEAMVSLSDMLSEADRKKMESHLKYIVNSCQNISAFNPSSINDYQAVIRYQEILSDSTIEAIYAQDTSHHYAFNNMDKNVHQRSGYTLALSRSSDRISKYEYMSGQNKKPWFQGDGAFYLYFTGADHNEEYGYQYIATVDPYRYPGTTVPVEIRKTVKELYGKDWYENPEHELNFTSSSVSQNDYVYFPVGTNTYSGSTVLGNYAAAGMQLGDDNAYAAKNAGILPDDFVVYKNANANKSWFMFDDEIVFLGSDIHDEKGRQVITTIDNRMVKGNVSVALANQMGTEMAFNNGEFEDVKWIHLEALDNQTQLGYYFPEGENVNLIQEIRSGNVKDVYGTKSVEIKNKQFITATIDHGLNPDHENYSYVVLPGMTKQEIMDYASSPKVKILKNDETVQAVEQTDLNIIGINFFNAGKVGEFSSSDPASVMIQKDSEAMTISLSDPTFKQATIHLVIDGKWDKADNNADYRIEMNQDTTEIIFNTAGKNGQSLFAHLKAKENDPQPTPESKPETEPEETELPKLSFEVVNTGVK